MTANLPVATFKLPIPLDAMPIIGELVGRVYGSGELLMRAEGETISILTPTDGFGPKTGVVAPLPSSADDGDLVYARTVDNRLEVTIDSGREVILPIVEHLVEWMKLLGATNYVELSLQSHGDENAKPDFVFCLQRAAGKTPHALRLKAERKLAAVEADLAAANAKLEAHGIV